MDERADSDLEPERTDPYTCRYVLEEDYRGGTSRVLQAICALKSEWRWHFGGREPRETCTCLEDECRRHSRRVIQGTQAYVRA